MSEKEDLRGVPAAIGVIVLALLFGGLVLAIYPGWSLIGGFLENNLKMSSQAPAWVQAIGALLLIIWGIFAFKTEFKEREAERDSRKNKDISHIKLLMFRNRYFVQRVDRLIWRLQQYEDTKDNELWSSRVRYINLHKLILLLPVVDEYFAAVEKFSSSLNVDELPIFLIDYVYGVEVEASKVKALINGLEFFGYHLDDIRKMNDIPKLKGHEDNSFEINLLNNHCGDIGFELLNIRHRLMNINDSFKRNIGY